MTDTVVMELSDGRELAWLELGDPNGPAVFVFHGTPGSRLQVSFDDRSIVASGVRFIAPDRPGYGHSSLHRGRRLFDWAADVAALADHLGIDRFSVVGISGGGPHALACARFLPDRIVAAGVVSGVGSLAEGGSEDGMMGFNRLVTRLARRSGLFVFPPIGFSAFVFRHWPDRALAASSRQLPRSDVEALERPDVKAAFVKSARHASSTNALAAAQDFGLFAADWGFRPEEIDVPVHIWHGTDDRNVPIAHARSHAARTNGATLHVCNGEGHMLVVEHFEEILRTVSSPAVRAPQSGGAAQ